MHASRKTSREEKLLFLQLPEPLSARVEAALESLEAAQLDVRIQPVTDQSSDKAKINKFEFYWEVLSLSAHE